MALYNIVCNACQDEVLGTLELADGVDPTHALQGYFCVDCAPQLQTSPVVEMLPAERDSK
jgi:hypothetical protein